MNTFEEQQDFEQAMYTLHRDRGESLLDFLNRATSVFANNDRHGDPLSDMKKGMLFLSKAKIDQTPGLETQLMAMTEGKRELSALIPHIRQLASRSGSESDTGAPGATFRLT